MRTELFFGLVKAIALKLCNIDQMLSIWLSTFSVIFMFTLAFIVRIKQKKSVLYVFSYCESNSVKAGVRGYRAIGNIWKNHSIDFFFTWLKWKIYIKMYTGDRSYAAIIKNRIRFIGASREMASGTLLKISRKNFDQYLLIHFI